MTLRQARMHATNDGGRLLSTKLSTHSLCGSPRVVHCLLGLVSPSPRLRVRLAVWLMCVACVVLEVEGGECLLVGECVQ